MKKLIVTSLIVLIAALAIVTGCKPDPSIDPRQEISFKVPQGWPEPFYTCANIPLSDERFELGRKLFCDPRLSRNNTVSCGSCHQPFSAFAQLDHNVSHGVDDLLGKSREW